HAIPYYENFDDFDLCPAVEDCIATCDLNNGWTNGINKLSDQIDWRIHRGATSTSGTGPNQDQNSHSDAGQYVYVEGSGACYDKAAELLSPCFDIGDSERAVFSFWYHMQGAQIGQLHIDLFDGEDWHMNVIVPLSGHQSDNWRRAQINLSAFQHKVINVRFRASTGFGHLSDIAIDNVALYDQGTEPIAAFTVDQTFSCPGAPIRFSDNSYHSPTQFTWDFGDPDRIEFVEGTSATDRNPVVQFKDASFYDVQLICSNANGTDTARLNDFIHISSGRSLPVAENFDEFQNSIINNWIIHNPDDQISWDLIEVKGIDDRPTQALYINNHSYDAIGELDELQSPVIDLQDNQQPILRFDISYAQYNKDYADGFLVLLSNDCGESFEEVIFEEEGTDLATVSDQTNGWSPTQGTDWRSKYIDLSAYAGQSIILRFSNICGFGNNLYLDNILIYEESTVPKAVIGMEHSSEVICMQEEVFFQNTADNAIDTEYFWTFGSNAHPAEASGAGPHVVTFHKAGAHNVTLVASNVIAQTVSNQLIEVLALPNSDFDHLETTAGEIQFNSIEFSEANTYLWDFGDGAQSTEAHPLHRYLTPGSYTVRLTISNNCGIQSRDKDIQVITTSIVAPNVDSSIQLQPNPAHSQVQVAFKGWSNEQWEARIYSLTGQLIQQHTLRILGSNYAHEFDLSDLAPGSYWIHLRSDQINQSFKLVVL
ncbi:MAG: PKD domain-containing protein, partial [Bacteroidota bacterium]